MRRGGLPDRSRHPGTAALRRGGGLARAALFAALALPACDGSPPGTTGGTDVAAGPFGRGVLSLNTSDAYDATTVSLVGLDGEVLSSSFLTAGLSGDVVAPSSPVGGGDVVLLDRWYSLVTWVDVRTAAVRAQLHADGDEIARNPWDYLPVAADKAYVTRYDPWPGNAEDGDIAIVDPRGATVQTPVDRRIDLAASSPLPSEYIVHPARGVVAGGRAYVVTVNATPDYAYADSTLLVIDTASDEVIDARVLADLHDCTAIALSPDHESLAIACSGDLQANADLRQERSGLLVLSRATLDERARFPASQLGAGVLGFSVSWVTNDGVLVLLAGNLLANVPDAAVLVPLGGGEVREVHASPPFTMGQVLCPARTDGETGPAASPESCYVTDAAAPALLRHPVDSGSLGPPRSIRVDTLVGLPPRYLGQF